MKRRLPSQRPQSFNVDNTHQLAQGLVFAGLGRVAGSTHYRDSSPYGRHGTLMNPSSGQWKNEQHIGRSSVLLTSASYQYISAPITSQESQNYTVSLWVNMYTLGSGATYFFDCGTSRTILRENGLEAGIVEFYTGSFQDTGMRAALNDWRHLAVSVTGTNAKCYQGGAKIASELTVTARSLGGSFCIGSRYEGDSSYVPCRISDFMVYSRALSGAEISALADPSNVMLSGLILPPRRRLWAVSGGAAPAVTAKGRAFLAGGGVYRFPRRTVRTGG